MVQYGLYDKEAGAMIGENPHESVEGYCVCVEAKALTVPALLGGLVTFLHENPE